MAHTKSYRLMRKMMSTLTLSKYCYTANASKLIEKQLLDFRNMFSNQENIRIFFSK